MIVSLSQWLLFSRLVNTSFSDGMDVRCSVPFRFILRLWRQLTRIPSPGDVFGLNLCPFVGRSSTGSVPVSINARSPNLLLWVLSRPMRQEVIIRGNNL